MPRILDSLRTNAGRLLDDVFAFISAPRCPACEEPLEHPRTPLCPNCECKFIYTGDGPVCLLCRKPAELKCDCATGYDFDIPQLYYWATYTDIVRALIHRFKFHRQMKLGEYLTGKALDSLHRRLLSAEFDMIVPIPMLKRDIKTRTFNQTELIAKTLSEKLGRPCEFEILRKIKPTRFQADLGREERWSNIVGAFNIENIGAVKGKSVLLVDDIVTTGATTIEATRVLHKADVKNVTVFAIASSH